MTELHTDEEIVEIIKKWWQANGVSVIVGVAIGLAAVFGYRAISNHRETTRQQASLAFEQVLAAVVAGDPERAERQAARLGEAFDGSVYVALGDLALARARVEANDLDGAAAALRTALSRAPSPALASLAALRLARVQFAQGDLTAATELIARHDDGGTFGGDFAALRGDIATAEGRFDDARSAYRQALDQGAALARVIELKLNDLPPDDA
ncbi:MAG: hypothetical protein EA400_07970 [Chromatiaceae bacterium]|nr:MAG: hypothetical protein EA400_07970 [Chromatiaceae bacterium]